MAKYTIYDMGNLVKKNDTVLAINIQKVKDKIAVIRNLEVIADADVAELYGVETKRINEAVKNNPDKFPASYMFVLNKSEVLELRSKISTTNVSSMNRNPTRDKLPHWQDQAHCQARAQGESRQEIAN